MLSLEILSHPSEVFCVSVNENPFDLFDCVAQAMLCAILHKSQPCATIHPQIENSDDDLKFLETYPVSPNCVFSFSWFGTLPKWKTGSEMELVFR